LIPTQPEQVRPKGLQPITLRQALNLAQRNNPALQVSRLSFARSVAQFQEAQALNFPTVLLQSGFSRAQSAAGDLAARASQNTFFPQENRYSQTFSGSIGLDYNVFDFGRRSGQIGAAKSQARASELQLEADTEDLLLNVAVEYYNLQQADENVRIARSAVRNAEASLRDTIALEQAGLGTRFDVLQAQVQLGQTQTTLTNALATQEQQRRQLAQRLNLPPDIDPTTADPVALAGEWTLPLADSIVLAFKNRAELQQQLAQRQAAQYQRQADLAALLPAFGLSAQYDFLNNLRTSAGFGNGYSVSANVNWNLFDGGAAFARARQQEANIAISENQFAVVRNQIQKGVEDAYYQLRSSRSNVDTSRLTVAQATEALRLARLRFQAGVGTRTDVINAENSLTRADADLANAILSYNRARAQLIRSISNFPLIPGAPVQ
ncbi:MAG TPA: TolC family protein, partial [Coleofasciculaceae cyanobacterium]